MLYSFEQKIASKLLRISNKQIFKKFCSMSGVNRTVFKKYKHFVMKRCLIIVCIWYVTISGMIFTMLIFVSSCKKEISVLLYNYKENCSIFPTATNKGSSRFRAITKWQICSSLLKKAKSVKTHKSSSLQKNHYKETYKS